MANAFAEAHRVLKPDAPLVCVYAHKTTLGWAALVEALRRARFTITEAWPLDTEMPERSIGQGTASLASSIFLVARRRDDETTGAYHEVVAELDGVIEERLERLTQAGVSGSDLVIATIGAALRPFTRHASVELPSGEPVAAETFLTDVQTPGARRGAGQGPRPRRGRRRDRRGDALLRPLAHDVRLGRHRVRRGQQPRADRRRRAQGRAGLRPAPARRRQGQGGAPARLRGARRATRTSGSSGTPLIDVLHGVLWRANHRVARPARLPRRRVRPDTDRLRAVAQALQGKALRDEGESKAPEAQACERLLGSWRTLVERNLEGRL